MGKSRREIQRKRSLGTKKKGHQIPQKGKFETFCRKSVKKFWRRQNFFFRTPPHEKILHPRLNIIVIRDVIEPFQQQSPRPQLLKYNAPLLDSAQWHFGWRQLLNFGYFYDELSVNFYEKMCTKIGGQCESEPSPPARDSNMCVIFVTREKR